MNEVVKLRIKEAAATGLHGKLSVNIIIWPEAIFQHPYTQMMQVTISSLKNPFQWKRFPQATDEVSFIVRAPFWKNKEKE